MPDNGRGDHAVTLGYPGGEHRMSSTRATLGASGIDLGTLRVTTGMVTLDPGLVNTADCTWEITYIDGEAGILRYRGYPIGQLAEHSTFLETSYLLIYGDLPTSGQLEHFTEAIRSHTLLHEDLTRFFDGFPRDAHPMPVLSSAVSALSTFYQDSLNPFDHAQVEISTVRLLAKLPKLRTLRPTFPLRRQRILLRRNRGIRRIGTQPPLQRGILRTQRSVRLLAVVSGFGPGVAGWSAGRGLVDCHHQ